MSTSGVSRLADAPIAANGVSADGTSATTTVECCTLVDIYVNTANYHQFTMSCYLMLKQCRVAPSLQYDDDDDDDDDDDEELSVTGHQPLR